MLIKCKMKRSNGMLNAFSDLFMDFSFSSE